MANQFSAPAGGAAPTSSTGGAAPTSSTGGTTSGDQQVIANWVTDLQRLMGVPFNYLVPDVGMLPAESIRFFTVDPNWMTALVDGAFSLGEAPVTAASSSAGAAPTPPTLSGFLLRSAVVAGWPGMEVLAYADLAATQLLTAVRLETVAPSLLLGIFTGTVRRVDFREPSEALHFGVDTVGNPALKALRWAAAGTGQTVGDVTGGTAKLPLRGTGQTNVLCIDQIASQVMAPAVGLSGTQSFTAAEFGLEMIEGVQVVSFQLDPTS